MERIKKGMKGLSAILVISTTLSFSGCFEDKVPPPKQDVPVKKEAPAKTIPLPVKPKEVQNYPVSDHWTEKGEQTLDGKTCSTWWMVSNVIPDAYFSAVKTHVLNKWPRADFQPSGADSARYQITIGKNAFDEDKTAQVRMVLSDAGNGARRVDWIATVNADDQMNATEILKTEAAQVFRLTSMVDTIVPGLPQQQTSTFLCFPVKGITDPWSAKISALMDHDSEPGKLKTFRGETDEDGLKALIDPKDKLRYFEKTNGEDFILTGLSNYKSPKQFYYDNHRGYDYSYGETEEVIAADGGVLDIKRMKTTGDAGLATYHAIAIKHDNGFVTLYLHLSKWSPQIEASFNDPAKQVNRIEKGTIIGNPGGFGKDGPTTFPVHLHFGVHNDKDSAVDPYGEYTKTGVQVAPILWEVLPADKE